MANMNAERHEHLTRPGVKYDEEMNICLLESDLSRNDRKSHANVVRFVENVSYMSTSTNLYQRKEQFVFMNETAIEEPGQTLAPLYT